MICLCRPFCVVTCIKQNTHKEEKRNRTATTQKNGIRATESSATREQLTLTAFYLSLSRNRLCKQNYDYDVTIILLQLSFGCGGCQKFSARIDIGVICATPFFSYFPIRMIRQNEATTRTTQIESDIHTLSLTHTGIGIAYPRVSARAC